MELESALILAASEITSARRRCGWSAYDVMNLLKRFL